MHCKTFSFREGIIKFSVLDLGLLGNDRVAQTQFDFVSSSGSVLYQWNAMSTLHLYCNGGE